MLSHLCSSPHQGAAACADARWFVPAQVSMLDNSNDSEVATVACSPTTPIIAPIKAMTSHDLVCDVLSRKFESWYVGVGGVCDGMTVDVTDPSKSAASS